MVFEREPETTTTGIRLFWKPIEKSFWNGQEITYVISVMKNHIRVKVYKATDSKAIIAGLQPSTTYIIVLYGKTTLGETPRTAKIATTKPSTFLLIHQKSILISFILSSIYPSILSIHRSLNYNLTIPPASHVILAPFTTIIIYPSNHL